MLISENGSGKPSARKSLRRLVLSMGEVSLRRTAANWVGLRTFFIALATYTCATATQQDIDGFLVGGASLKPEFVDIINAKVPKL